MLSTPKMLSFFSGSGGTPGLIYHRPSGENFSFDTLPDDGRSISRNVAEKHYDSRHDKLRNTIAVLFREWKKYNLTN